MLAPDIAGLDARSNKLDARFNKNVVACQNLSA